MGDLSDPLATVALSGLPRSGLLALPPPRGVYTITLERIAASPDVTLTATGALGTTRTELAWFAPHLDNELRAVDGHWHGHARIDGYEWRVRVNERATRLDVFEAVQPYTGPAARIDERGQVMA